MLPLALSPINERNPLFQMNLYRSALPNSLFHPPGAPKGFQSGFAGKEIIFVSSSSVITAGLSLLSPGATEVLPVIKIYQLFSDQCKYLQEVIKAGNGKERKESYSKPSKNGEKHMQKCEKQWIKAGIFSIFQTIKFVSPTYSCKRCCSESQAQINQPSSGISSAPKGGGDKDKEKDERFLLKYW